MGQTSRIAPLWTVQDVADYLRVPVQTLYSQDVADYLRVPVQTLYSWRMQGRGPRARKIGKYLRYRAEDVIAWLEQLDDEAA